MRPAAEFAPEIQRLKVVIRGAVQGVGFRPFVFRLARQLELSGWVTNSAQGVLIEVEGRTERLKKFLSRVSSEKPPQSCIQSLESVWLDPIDYPEFVIRSSESCGAKTAWVLADIATCELCRSEIFDAQNRRYFYPFTNCTNCGPRFSIVEGLPYDRGSTSMKGFRMCRECQQEYDDPEDRRFHAQPNACLVCGPQLELWDEAGRIFESTQGGSAQTVLRAAADKIRAGQVLALKGIGGFQLIASARDGPAIQRLRERKHRIEKPFAIMFPNVESAQRMCRISAVEDRLLRSPEAPIVLLRKLTHVSAEAISSLVAPGNPDLGVMLPYSPLHHLLMALLDAPVIATSGNISDEPICIDEGEAVERLKGIADAFLVHNRPIVRHVDDSVVRLIAGREMILRRARGYAPLSIQLSRDDRPTPGLTPQSTSADATTVINPARVSSPPRGPVLAVGAHLKNAVALNVGPDIFISQHIGDLETAQADSAFRRVVADLQNLYSSPASLLAADSHPDYGPTRFAQSSGTPVILVQHHVAHVLSCMADNQIEPPVLGVSWDGTGYGLDGTVWGGEFFRIHSGGFERVAHFRQFRLPGGEKAVREPRRSALGVLFETFGEDAVDTRSFAQKAQFSSVELATMKSMLVRHLNSPLTSSVGRLFDALASLAGLRQLVTFEGQAAMELEFVLPEHPALEAYEAQLQESNGTAIIDWRPAVKAAIADLSGGASAAVLSSRFHNMLVESLIGVARRTGLERVVLSGGCFQNRYLTETSVKRLKQDGFQPYWHQRVPPNDGGICLGQIIAAQWWNV